MYAYPVELVTDQGVTVVEFPDVPEAHAVGRDEENALEWAQDALHVALSGYMDMGRDIPAPSQSKAQSPVVEASPLVQMKLAVYTAMREQNVTRSRLARLLHCDARQVRRILDLDHNSTVDQLTDALHVLGVRLRMQAETVTEPPRYAPGVYDGAA
jgi:antitoxin HicB